ncbi:MAG TPA: EpsG family protein [Sphingomicrobium sp.]|nr:EpsG family protein [Sphingomicrobium sp.]
MIVYWLIFAIFAAGAISYASTVSRMGMLPVSGPMAAAISRRSVVLTVMGIALVVLIGLRYRVGGDWSNYLDIFRRLAPQELGAALAGSRQEPAYTFVNWLAARLGAGIWLVNLICAVPFTYGLLRLCRQQPNPWLAMLVATPFLIIVVGMGFTRQAAALGCLMVGISKIIDRRSPVEFVLWTLGGALFHQTVLVFIPVMFVTGVKNRFLSYLLLLASLAVGYYAVLPSALDQYGPGYLREQYNAAGANVRVLMDVVPAAIVLLSKGRFYWSAEEKAVWRTYAALCLLAGAALPFIHSSVVVDRLAMYLIPMQIFVYSRIGYCFGLIRRGWLAWTTAVIVYSAAVLFVWLNYAVNAWAWVPYQNYLSTPDRY